MLNGEDVEGWGTMQSPHSEDERLETQDGLYPNRTAMGSLLSTFHILILHSSTPSAAFWVNWDICLSAWGIPFVPDVCRTMDGMEAGGNLNCLNYRGHLQTDVPEAVL